MENHVRGCKERLDSDMFKRNMRNAQRAQGKDDGGANRELMGDMEALARVEKMLPELQSLEDQVAKMQKKFDGSAAEAAKAGADLSDFEESWASEQRQMVDNIRAAGEKAMTAVKEIEAGERN